MIGYARMLIDTLHDDTHEFQRTELKAKGIQTWKLYRMIGGVTGKLHTHNTYNRQHRVCVVVCMLLVTYVYIYDQHDRNCNEVMK